MPVLGHTIGKQVCAALGLPPEKVEGLTIRVFAGDVVTVIVQMHPTEDEIGNLWRVFKSYTLTEDPPSV